MKSGVVGRVEGSFARVEPSRRTETEDGLDLTDQIDVTGVKRTPDGLDITTGRAASQSVRDSESVSLAPDGITVESERSVHTAHTEFVTVSGEFVAVASSAGTFCFDLLATQTGTTIDRATFDLNDVADSFPEAAVWKVGFVGDDGQNGVVHGTDLRETGVFGDSVAALDKNQLGLDVDYEGRQCKLLVTRSGYVDIYRPSDLSTAEFAEFVSEELLPHAV